MNIATPATFTEIYAEQNYSLSASGQAAYAIRAAAGAQAPAWSHDDVTGSASEGGWTALVATFKAVAASTARPLRGNTFLD